MIGMRVELQTICAEWGAATVNGVYQGIIITAAIGLVLRMLARTNAATRYAVWFVSLMLIVLILPAHFWLDRRLGDRAGLSQAYAAVSSTVSRPAAPLFDSNDSGIIPF